jgi:hypothetical protein
MSLRSTTPPVITSNGGGTSSTRFVAENTTALPAVHATDPDGPILAYSIVHGSGSPDAGKFSIDATTGALSFLTPPNYENPTDSNHNNIYTVEVQASDGTLTDTQTLSVHVTDVNEAPAITSNGGHSTASISVAENHTVVTTVQATDPDFDDHVHYSILRGGDSPDAGKFTINWFTGQLSFNAASDYEHPTDAGSNNSYVVKVQASDGSLTDTQIITVNVTNVNEAPAITSDGGHSTANVNVAENSTAVTTVQATDPDAGTTLHYSLVHNFFSSPDAGDFTITAAGGALSFLTPPDYEKPADSNQNNNYIVQVSASDGHLSDTQTINVHVTNANEEQVPAGLALDPVQDLADGTLSMPGVTSGDVLSVTPAPNNYLGTFTATAAAAGLVDWQFNGTNSQLDQLAGHTQTYTVHDQTHPGSAQPQTIGVSIGGEGNDQFVFNAGSGAHDTVNFSTRSDQSGHYFGDTIELEGFTNGQLTDALAGAQDVHGTAVVNFNNGDSITFEHVSASIVQAQAGNLFHVGTPSA